MEHTFDAAHIKKIIDWLGTGSINIFGMPFAGKDTQGKNLADIFNGLLLGGGDILRNSAIPERSRQALKAGKLIPIEDYLEIVLPYLSNPSFQKQPLILSSVGRWHGEEQGVLAAAEQSGHPMKAVYYLHISEAEAQRRLAKSQESRSQGERADRDDDQLDILHVRVEEFLSKTMPVIDYYRQTPLYTEIDAERPGAQVTAAIITDLLNRVGNE